MPNRTYLTEEDERKMVDAYRAGATTLVLAQTFHIGNARVFEILHRHGVETNRRNHRSEAEEQQILTEYQAGVTKQELRKKYHIGSDRLSQLLHPERRKPKPKDRMVQREEVRRERRTVSHIDENAAKAKALGMSYGQYMAMQWRKQEGKEIL